MTADLGPLQSPPGPVVALPRRPRPVSTPDSRHVLVVDPHVDPQRIADELGACGLRVTCVRSTLDGLVAFGRTAPAAVVVAPDCPGLPASDFVSTVRAHSDAVVVAALSCAEALEAGPLMLAGAAAAVTRPYTARTLLATLERVPGGWASPSVVLPAPEASDVVAFGPLEVDPVAYAVRVHGERLADLPLKEFEMLRVLVARAPAVVSNDDLRVALWGEADGRRSDNTLAVHAARLRHRLAGVAALRRVRGRGYSLTLA